MVKKLDAIKIYEIAESGYTATSNTKSILNLYVETKGVPLSHVVF